MDKFTVGQLLSQLQAMENELRAAVDADVTRDEYVAIYHMWSFLYAGDYPKGEKDFHETFYYFTQLQADKYRLTERQVRQKARLAA